MLDDTASKDRNYVVSELKKIRHFLEVARRFGIAVTATPQGVAVIEKSDDPDAQAILNNLCKVEKDPWAAR